MKKNLSLFFIILASKVFAGQETPTIDNDKSKLDIFWNKNFFDVKWGNKKIPCDFDGGSYSIYSRNSETGQTLFVGGKPSYNEGPHRFSFGYTDEKSIVYSWIAFVGQNEKLKALGFTSNEPKINMTQRISFNSDNSITIQKEWKQIDIEALIKLGQKKYENKTEETIKIKCNSDRVDENILNTQNAQSIGNNEGNQNNNRNEKNELEKSNEYHIPILLLTNNINDSDSEELKSKKQEENKKIIELNSEEEIKTNQEIIRGGFPNKEKYFEAIQLNFETFESLNNYYENKKIEELRQIAEARKKAEEEKRRMEEEAARKEEEYRQFPYTATFTCILSRNHTDMLHCLLGDNNVKTAIEIQNGKKYEYYRFNDINRLGRQTRDGLSVKLGPSFHIIAQNASSDLVLGLEIRDNYNQEILFQKKVGIYGVINVTNPK